MFLHSHSKKLSFDEVLNSAYRAKSTDPITKNSPRPAATIVGQEAPVTGIGASVGVGVGGTD